MKPAFHCLIVTENEARVDKVDLFGKRAAICRFGVPKGTTDKYQYKLHQSNDLLLIVLPADRTRIPFMLFDDDAGGFRRVEPVPGIGTIEHNYCNLHQCGILTVIDSRIIWLHDISAQIWKSIALPVGFSGRDAAFYRGELFVAGSLDIGAKRRRGSLIYLREQEWREMDFDLPSSDAKRLKDYEAPEIFYKSFVLNDRLFLVSDCAWFLDDPSSFLYCYNDGKWNLLFLKNDSVQNIASTESGYPLFILISGAIMSIDESGTRFVKYSSIPGKHQAVANSDSKAECIAVASKVYSYQHSPHAALQKTAILTSCDYGRTFDHLTDIDCTEYVGGVAIGEEKAGRKRGQRGMALT